MDEVRLWNVARSQADIMKCMRDSSGLEHHKARTSFRVSGNVLWWGLAGRGWGGLAWMISIGRELQGRELYTLKRPIVIQIVLPWGQLEI